MVVKTSVNHRAAESERSGGEAPSAADTRKLLDECRRMMLELLQQRRER